VHTGKASEKRHGLMSDHHLQVGCGVPADVHEVGFNWHVAAAAAPLPAKLCLKHVYGYEGRRAAAPNLYFTAHGDVVFYVSTLGVVASVASIAADSRADRQGEQVQEAQRGQPLEHSARLREERGACSSEVAAAGAKVVLCAREGWRGREQKAGCGLAEELNHHVSVTQDVDAVLDALLWACEDEASLSSLLPKAALDLSAPSQTGGCAQPGREGDIRAISGSQNCKALDSGSKSGQRSSITSAAQALHEHGTAPADFSVLAQHVTAYGERCAREVQQGRSCVHQAKEAGDGLLVVQTGNSISEQIGEQEKVRGGLSQARQSFFQGHTNDVLCLAMHPNRLLAATGQVQAPTCSSCCCTL
jgi:hypothetical protein